jgi:hypothetical protein
VHSLASPCKGGICPHTAAASVHRVYVLALVGTTNSQFAIYVFKTDTISRTIYRCQFTYWYKCSCECALAAACTQQLSVYGNATALGTSGAASIVTQRCIPFRRRNTANRMAMRKCFSPGRHRVLGNATVLQNENGLQHHEATQCLRRPLNQRFTHD